ncbi:MAG: Gll3385 protein, partial [uncultured Sphingomonadaceae bacterium]
MWSSDSPSTPAGASGEQRPALFRSGRGPDRRDAGAAKRRERALLPYHPAPSHRYAAGPSLSRKGRGAIIALLALAGCENAPAAPSARGFPPPDRPVASIVSSAFSDEDARDALGEAETVMRLAGVAPGMSVADIGAGDGYYTIRLSPLVGPKGRVVAQDIIPETRDKLARRVERERLDNVYVRLGTRNDARLPPASFDRVLMINMYHEIAQPAEFLWHLRGSLKPGGSVVVVDAERPTANHGTPRALLVCEFRALGYTLTRFEQLADRESYF